MGCPLHNRIPEWLAATAEGRFLDAAMLSRSTSNMPEICSRVCPQERLCEGSCILNGRAEPVTIGAIERFINEYAFEKLGTDVVRAEPNGLRVAVIGSGPGGLAAADELAARGYAVTVFESQNLPGGLLVNGIPAFKLENSIVTRRIEMLERCGVEFRLECALGKDVSLDGLLRDHAAVFLGFGAQQAKPLGIPGENLVGVLQALPFLIQKNVDFQVLDMPPIEVAGKRVAVLGGGDTAMDCLRTAVRCGASAVFCLYRRDLANMPGSRKEYANALEEGADFRFLINPTAIEGDASGAVARVRCERMELGAPDASGRRKPQPVANSEFTVEADLVIGAYGFDPVPFPPGERPGSGQNQQLGRHRRRCQPDDQRARRLRRRRLGARPVVGRPRGPRRPQGRRRHPSLSRSRQVLILKKVVCPGKLDRNRMEPMRRRHV